MPTTILRATDIFSPELITMPSMPPTLHTPDPVVTCRHPQAGQVQVRSTGFPHLQVMNMCWQTDTDFELHDPTACDGVSINFVLSGALDSRFKGLKHDLAMRTRTHNLIHTPETGHVNRFKGGQTLSMLLINLDKSFFMSSVGQGDAWSDRILNELAHERPFAGAPGTSEITPQMLSLIDDIRSGHAVGPMRNLLIQSRVLELLALQLEQYRTPVAQSDTVLPDEAEKLYQLKAYLEANFLADHSLAALSRYCALNEFKVKKGFRQLFDTTVFNYLRKLRMEHAGQLLRHCALSVDEVADRLGYEHSQHFSIAFRKFVGLTPSQYQQGRSDQSTAKRQIFA